MTIHSALCAALALAASAAIGQNGALPIRQVMQDGVNPAILAVWDVGNEAMNDEGGIDPAKMDQADWDRIAEAAAQLAGASRAIVNADAVSAAAPADGTVAESEIPMAQVQRYIDADLDGLRELALEQADYADRLRAAALTRDAAAAGDLVAGMDQVCESCHMRYWYPEG